MKISALVLDWVGWDQNELSLQYYHEDCGQDKFDHPMSKSLSIHLDQNFPHLCENGLGNLTVNMSIQKIYIHN